MTFSEKIKIVALMIFHVSIFMGSCTSFESNQLQPKKQVSINNFNFCQSLHDRIFQFSDSAVNIEQIGVVHNQALYYSVFCDNINILSSSSSDSAKSWVVKSTNSYLNIYEPYIKKDDSPILCLANFYSPSDTTIIFDPVLLSTRLNGISILYGSDSAELEAVRIFLMSISYSELDKVIPSEGFDVIGHQADVLLQKIEANTDWHFAKNIALIAKSSAGFWKGIYEGTIIAPPNVTYPRTNALPAWAVADIAGAAFEGCFDLWEQHSEGNEELDGGRLARNMLKGAIGTSLLGGGVKIKIKIKF